MSEQKTNMRNFKAELTAIIMNMSQTGEPVKLNDELRKKILEIYAGNSEITIATVRPDGWPQANVVDFSYIGLTMYFQSFESSQKAKNLEKDPRISLTITPPFNDFGEMLALSMAAHAERVTDRSEIAEMHRLFLERVPHMTEFSQYEGDKVYPGPGMVVYRLLPQIVSILDYTKGYGHIDLVQFDDNASAE